MNCDHLSRAVVAELQQDDLPAPKIMEKGGESSRLTQLGLNVSTDSLAVNNENTRPVARKIMKRKESRNKRSSSQSSSRAVTPDPGRHRFNPRKDGFSALYNCLIKLYNASSDGIVSWNEARNLYRKEVGRHLNSEELNLICGTANRTKHELLHTKLATIIEPVDTKGFFIRMLLDQEGAPVPLPSPSASDDDSTTRQSLSRLASIEDEEKLQMEEKRREIMEKLMSQGLLNSEGRATAAENQTESNEVANSTVWKLDREESEESQQASFVESLQKSPTAEEKPKMVGVVIPFRVNTPEKDESVMDGGQNHTEETVKINEKSLDIPEVKIEEFKEEGIIESELVKGEKESETIPAEEEKISASEHRAEVLEKMIHMDFENLSVEEETAAFREGIEEIFGHETAEIEAKKTEDEENPISKNKEAGKTQDIQIQETEAPLGEWSRANETAIVCSKELIQGLPEEAKSSGPPMEHEKKENEDNDEEMLALVPPRPTLSCQEEEERETRRAHLGSDLLEPPPSPVTPVVNKFVLFGEIEEPEPVVEGLAKAIVEKAVEEAIKPAEKKGDGEELSGDAQREEEKTKNKKEEAFFLKNIKHGKKTVKELEEAIKPAGKKGNEHKKKEKGTEKIECKEQKINVKKEEEDIQENSKNSKELEENDQNKSENEHKKKEKGTEKIERKEQKIITEKSEDPGAYSEAKKIEEEASKMKMSHENSGQAILINEIENLADKKEISSAKIQKSEDFKILISSMDNIAKNEMNQPLTAEETSIQVALSNPEDSDFVNAEVVAISEVKTAERKSIHLEEKKVPYWQSEMVERKPAEFAQIWNKPLGSPLSKSDHHDFSKLADTVKIKDIFGEPKKADCNCSEEGSSSKTSQNVTQSETQDELAQAIDVPFNESSIHSDVIEVIGEEPQTDNVSPPVPAPRQVKKTVTLEVELNKVNEEYKELVNWVGEGAACSRAEGTAIPVVRSNRVSDIVVSLEPSQDLERKDMPLSINNTKQKKPKGKMFCCFCFRRPSFLKK